MLRRALDNIEYLIKKLKRNVIMKQITHRVDEIHSWLAALQWFGQTIR